MKRGVALAWLPRPIGVMLRLTPLVSVMDRCSRREPIKRQGVALRSLGSLITATLLGIGDYVGLHVVFRRTKISVFLSIIPPQLLGFYKVANTVLLSISEPRVSAFAITACGEPHLMN